MKSKKWYKIISIILAISMLISSLGMLNISAEDTTSASFDLKALIEEHIAPTNETTMEDLENIMLDYVDDVIIEQGYAFEEITDFYKMDAIGGAYEIGKNNGGSTYTGAPLEDTVLVEGINGYIVANIALYNENDDSIVNTVVTLKIEAPMEGYKYTSVSNSINDWTGNNTSGWKYNKGWIDKVIIPDEITKLQAHWHNYQKFKCIVYGSGLKNSGSANWTPDTRAVEVIVLNDNITEIGTWSFQNLVTLKYIRIPDSVTIIRDQAFMACRNLKSLYIPDSVKTIGEQVLGKDTTNNHNLTELTIPASVETIAANAFYGANNPFVITVLGNNTSVQQTTFFNGENTNNNIVRVVKGSVADTNVTASADKKLYVDDMTLCEAVARAAYQADIANTKRYTDADKAIADADTILAKAKSAYGDLGKFTTTFANAEWSVGFASVVNKIAITDGTDTAEFDVVLAVESGSLDDKLTVSDDTTKDTLKTQIEELIGCTVTIEDYYKIKSMPQVIEPDGNILVPGEFGYVSAYYSAVDENGISFDGSILVRIAPEKVEKNYTSVSDSLSDWTGDNQSGYKYAGNAIDKLVIPDEVTNLAEHWHNWQPIKCVVYGTGLKSTGTAVWSGNSKVLEVVSFKGNIETVSANAFHSASNLKYIRLPDSVKTIQDGAFRKCTSLEYLYLPEGLEWIGSDIFYKAAEDNIDDSGDTTSHKLGTLNYNLGYKISEITVPASVSTIKSRAFVGAAADVTFTFLGRNGNQGDWDVMVVSGADASMTQHVKIRTWSGDVYSAQYYMNYKNPADTVERIEYLNNTMGAAETRARAQQAADRYADKSYGSLDEITAAADTILTRIHSSYNRPSYAPSWKYDWAGDSGFLYNNTAVIVAGDKNIEIPFSAKKSGEFDLQPVVEASDIKVDNNTAADTLEEILAANGFANYDVEVIDFYLKKAVNGACEKVGTGTEVLVPGEKGRLAAIVKITANNGSSVTSSLMLDIDYTMQEYTFGSVSNSINDWTGNNTSGWKYNKGQVDKLIIPDEITKLADHWHNWQPIKCVVYGTGLKSTGSASWTGNSKKVEVVVLNNNITEIGSWSFQSLATLKYIKIPDSVTIIRDQAFEGCKGLESLTIPESVTTIGRWIFGKSGASNTHNLTELTIPATVETVMPEAFSGAINPFVITVLGENTSVQQTTFFNGDATNNNIVRVVKGSVADEYVTASADKKLYLDDISVCEAAVRTADWAETAKDNILDNVTKYETQIKNAYFNASSITLSWENREWTESGANMSNTAILSDGVNEFGVDVSLLAPTGFYASGREILTTAQWEANGRKQGLRFFNSYKSSSVDKIDIDGTEYAIKEFGILIKNIANSPATAQISLIDDESFVIGAVGVICEAGEISTISRNEDTGRNQFSTYIKNIPQGGSNYWFQARGYITYIDASGNEVTIYTNSQLTSAAAEYELVNSEADYTGMGEWFALS